MEPLSQSHRSCNVEVPIQTLTHDGKPDQTDSDYLPTILSPCYLKAARDYGALLDVSKHPSKLVEN